MVLGRINKIFYFYIKYGTYNNRKHDLVYVRYPSSSCDNNVIEESGK